jgi:hypothetical protein
MNRKLKKYGDFINESNGLKLPEIVDGFFDGTIKVNEMGHSINEHRLDYSFGSMQDGIKRYTTKEELKKIGEILLNDEIPIGSMISTLIGSFDVSCGGCGQNLKPILKSKNEISLIGIKDFNEMVNKQKVDSTKWSWNETNTIDISKIKPCEIGEIDKITTEIDVNSGKLLFTNFFNEKEIYDPKEEDFDINSLLGRVKLAKKLAEKNVGYGQMGNMSVRIFKNSDGTEIIVGTTYMYDEDDNDIDVEFEGFEEIGDISLSVWRWMCADLETLDKWNESYPDMKPNTHVEDDYKDYVLLDVKAGRWVIDHYYDFSETNDGIYSKLYLKK